MDYNISKQKEVVNNIIDISEKIEDELKKDEINEDEIFKLRYAQFIQGLHLNFNNNISSF